MLDISIFFCKLNVKSTAIAHIKVLQYRVTRPLKILGSKC